MRGRANKANCPKCHQNMIEVLSLRSRHLNAGDTEFRAEVRCENCGHEWLSKHPRMLREAKEIAR